MEFVKYQHVERFGTTETSGIEMGLCYVFPKIDGTNGQLWLQDGVVKAGSRNRALTDDFDNQGFLKWVVDKANYLMFFAEYYNVTLYGEWLVPHTLKTYTEESWRKFYVFDVVSDGVYIPYEEYKEWLDEYDIDYIPPICKVKNPTYERLVNQLEKNTFLIKDGAGSGEGVVVKNYDYKNKYGRVIWAKIVKNEFKVKHQKVNDVCEVQEKKLIEEEITQKYITLSLIDKEKAKIENDSDGWSTKFIPRLLNTVYYCLIKEESWNFVKEHKRPMIDFGRLHLLTVQKIKELKPEIF